MHRATIRIGAARKQSRINMCARQVPMRRRKTYLWRVDEGVYYVIFGQEKLPDGTESDVTGMVIQRNSESAFGYNVIAARGYC